MRANRISLPKMAVIVLAGLVNGCTTGDSTGDLKQWVAEVSARQRPNIQPLPEIQPYRTFLYSAHTDGLRDPFTSTFGENNKNQNANGGSDDGLHPDLDRPKEALEDFPLDSLRMMGILQQRGNVWGVVQAPDSAVYRLRKGDHMGQNYGEVVDITENNIMLWEIIPNGTGGWQRREASLALNETQ